MLRRLRVRRRCLLLLRRCNLHLDSIRQSLAGIADDLLVAGQALSHFQFLPEVSADLDLLPDFPGQCEHGWSSLMRPLNVLTVDKNTKGLSRNQDRLGG